jgi:hypothetical protein
MVQVQEHMWNTTKSILICDISYLWPPLLHKTIFFQSFKSSYNYVNFERWGKIWFVNIFNLNFLWTFTIKILYLNLCVKMLVLDFNNSVCCLNVDVIFNVCAWVKNNNFVCEQHLSIESCSFELVSLSRKIHCPLRIERNKWLWYCYWLLETLF